MQAEKDAMVLAALRGKYGEHDLSGFELSDFLAAFGSPLDAFMYLRLFCPEFVLFEGMLFRKETIEDAEDRRRVLEGLVLKGGDKTKTEQSFNLVEIPSGIFSRRGNESSDELDEYLAERLVELWGRQLSALVPGRKLVVSVVPADETGGETGIMFYIDRGLAVD